MCITMMNSMVDQQEINDPNWLVKYVETENILLDYLKALCFTSYPGDAMVESILPEYDGSESVFEAIDNLYDWLSSVYENNTPDEQQTDTAQIELEKKKDPRSKRSLKCLSSHYGKELQVKPNRARSHSSVGVDEILRTQDLIDIGASSRRKSRRVSLGVRPRFSNWSRVKDAFKRDKSSSRLDSRDADYPDMCYSGEDKMGGTSSDEDFEFYNDGFNSETGVSYQVDDNFEHHLPEIDRSSSRTGVAIFHNLLSKDKSSLKSSHNSPNVNSPVHKNPFKWYRTKSITPTGNENDQLDETITPPSPYKNSSFLYDEESVANIINAEPSSFKSKCVDLPQEIPRYDSLPKSSQRSSIFHLGDNSDDSKLVYGYNLSPSFRQKFQEWQKIKGMPPTDKAFNPLKKCKSDWHKWRPGSKSESNVLRFLDKENNANRYQMEELNCYGDLEDRVISSKQQTLEFLKSKQPVEKKELAWLEKELQKVAREKQRLEKEKEKYAERETRLQNMKRAIKSGRKRKQEVLVPTSTGLIRFQGINSKFTRKLYEWEKAKGIKAESSTFAFLDPSYKGLADQRTKKSPIVDVGPLSRSRSVGSVDVTGVGTALQHDVSLNHQQSSLSLNDMEQLEEAQLQVADDSIMRSSENLFDKEDEHNGIDLITKKTFNIPDYNETEVSRNIPVPSSSNKFINENIGLSTNGARTNKLVASKDANVRKASDGFSSGSENVFHTFQTDAAFVIPTNKERNSSANADAENIVNQIKKLRAGTSTDDEDRLNTLSNLQNLADKLLEMVHVMNTKKTENVDDLASKIATLAIELKNEIKNLTTDELHTKDKYSNGAKNPSDFNYSYVGEEYTDTENDSPTVHCTFTLPSWRIKHTTPSSTESESSKKKYPERGQKVRKYGGCKKYGEDSSGDDGGDETTVCLDLRKPKGRRDSSDNLSTSNSESLVSQEHNVRKRVESKPEPEVLCCSLSIDKERKNELKANYSTVKQPHVDSEMDDEVEKHLAGSDSDDQTVQVDVRSYSPKPTLSKRKCTSCGKVKRISKSRKISTSSYCPCERGKPSTDHSGELNQTAKPPNTLEAPFHFAKSASYHNEDLSSQISKISRSKVYNFNSFQNIDKSSTESDVSRINADFIVPTTRKIFAPYKLDEHGGTKEVISYTIQDSKRDFDGNLAKLKDDKGKLKSGKKTILELHDKLPPASPISTRRNLNKENNSSIKMMIAHYNKLTSEKSERRSSDGNCWSTSLQKSPVFEHRNRFEYLQKESELNSIRKSKSATLAIKGQQGVLLKTETNCEPKKGVLKSSSAGSIHYQSSDTAANATSDNRTSGHGDVKIENTSLQQTANKLDANNEEAVSKVAPRNIESGHSVTSSCSSIAVAPQPLERNTSFENVLSETKMRNLKLQEAKNKFFNEYPSKITIAYKQNEVNESDSKTENAECKKAPDDDSYFNNMALNKSVSTGAIDDRLRGDQTTAKTPPKSKFGFSSIASKFRKVKMRRHRDPELSTVSSLCRASLLINIDKDKQKEYLNASKSCPSSPVMQRTSCKRNSSSN